MGNTLQSFIINRYYSVNKNPDFNIIFEQRLKKDAREEKLSVIVVSREYCRPCQMFKPRLKEIAIARSKEPVSFFWLEGTNQMKWDMMHRIKIVPTLLYYWNNELIKCSSQGHTEQLVDAILFEKQLPRLHQLLMQLNIPLVLIDIIESYGIFNWRDAFESNDWFLF
jgi:hypothetical protein